MELGLAGRIVLVTGGSQGIGRAIAEAFGREGARVAVTYRTNADGAHAVAERIREAGGDAFECQFNLADRATIERAVATTVGRWGHIDVLVNNAVEWGPRTLAEPVAFEELPVAEWQGLLHANVDGACSTIQLVVPLMKQRLWGRIVTISSSVVETGLAGTGWYSAAKAALHGLTRTLAKELAPYDVLANVVMPGPTLTGHVVRAYPALAHAQAAKKPAGRKLLDPDDIAPLVVYLGSAANRIVTGQIVAATAGMSPPAVVLPPASARGERS